MMNNCVLCGKQGTEQHHVIKRSQATSLKNCKLNLVWLCVECHRGTYGVHGKQGKRNDIKLRAIYYSQIRRLFNKPTYRIEEIKDILNITLNEATRLSKTIYNIHGNYTRENILIALMGGKLDIQITELGECDNE